MRKSRVDDLEAMDVEHEEVNMTIDHIASPQLKHVQCNTNFKVGTSNVF